MLNDFMISENFRLSEFHCRHCQQVKLHSRLVELLQRLRSEIGRPVVITSGYRCKEHNTAVGGSKNSLHMQGMAADIRLPANWAGNPLLDLAEETGFTGLGNYEDMGFVHVDIRPGQTVRFR